MTAFLITMIAMHLVFGTANVAKEDTGASEVIGFFISLGIATWGFILLLKG